MEIIDISNISRSAPYFSYADTESSIFYPNRSQKIKTKAKILRRYLALHAILYDKVIFLDSSLLHNQILEHLCLQEDLDRSIIPLLESGFIIPAMRKPVSSFSQLFDIFKKIRDGSLDSWGNERYAQLLDKYMSYTIEWDREKAGISFGELFKETIKEQNNSYFTHKMPYKLINSIINAMDMDKEINKRSYYTRGSIKNEYILDVYKGYKTPLKLLSDHLYYVGMGNQLNIDVSYSSTLQQMEYIQKTIKKGTCKPKAIIDIFKNMPNHESFDYSFETFLMNAKFWDDGLKFEQLLSAKEKLRSAEYGAYLQNLNKASYHPLNEKFLRELMQSFINYLRELEAILTDTADSHKYLQLKEKYKTAIRMKLEDQVALLIFALCIPSAPILMVILTVANHIYSQYIDKKYDKVRENIFNLREDIKKKVIENYPLSPIKVAIDTYL